MGRKLIWRAVASAPGHEEVHVGHIRAVTEEALAALQKCCEQEGVHES
ncbi:hypothetical protein [Escherichia coli]|nr:hypothetical protein [Escherichia coli]GDM24193.1 hypothetical protein BvCmsNSNP012_04885 [Escherichia coli]